MDLIQERRSFGLRIRFQRPTLSLAPLFRICQPVPSPANSTVLQALLSQKTVKLGEDSLAQLRCNQETKSVAEEHSLQWVVQEQASQFVQTNFWEHLIELRLIDQTAGQNSSDYKSFNVLQNHPFSRLVREVVLTRKAGPPTRERYCLDSLEPGTLSKQLRYCLQLILCEYFQTLGKLVRVLREHETLPDQSLAHSDDKRLPPAKKRKQVRALFLQSAALVLAGEIGRGLPGLNEAVEQLVKRQDWPYLLSCGQLMNLIQRQERKKVAGWRLTGQNETAFLKRLKDTFQRGLKSGYHLHCARTLLHLGALLSEDGYCPKGLDFVREKTVQMGRFLFKEEFHLLCLELALIYKKLGRCQPESSFLEYAIAALEGYPLISCALATQHFQALFLVKKAVASPLVRRLVLPRLMQYCRNPSSQLLALLLDVFSEQISAEQTAWASSKIEQGILFKSHASPLELRLCNFSKNQLPIKVNVFTRGQRKGLFISNPFQKKEFDEAHEQGRAVTFSIKIINRKQHPLQTRLSLAGLEGDQVFTINPGINNVELEHKFATEGVVQVTGLCARFSCLQQVLPLPKPFRFGIYSAQPHFQLSFPDERVVQGQEGRLTLRVFEGQELGLHLQISKMTQDLQAALLRLTVIVYYHQYGIDQNVYWLTDSAAISVTLKQEDGPFPLKRARTNFRGISKLQVVLDSCKDQESKYSMAADYSLTVECQSQAVESQGHCRLLLGPEFQVQFQSGDKAPGDQSIAKLDRLQKLVWSKGSRNGTILVAAVEPEPAFMTCELKSEEDRLYLEYRLREDCWHRVQLEGREAVLLGKTRRKGSGGSLQLHFGKARPRSVVVGLESELARAQVKLQLM